MSKEKYSVTPSEKISDFLAAKINTIYALVLPYKRKTLSVHLATLQNLDGDVGSAFLEILKGMPVVARKNLFSDIEYISEHLDLDCPISPHGTFNKKEKYFLEPGGNLSNEIVDALNVVYSNVYPGKKKKLSEHLYAFSKKEGVAKTLGVALNSIVQEGLPKKSRVDLAEELRRIEEYFEITSADNLPSSGYVFTRDQLADVYKVRDYTSSEDYAYAIRYDDIILTLPLVLELLVRFQADKIDNKYLIKFVEGIKKIGTPFYILGDDPIRCRVEITRFSVDNVEDVVELEDLLAYGREQFEENAQYHWRSFSAKNK